MSDTTLAETLNPLLAEFTGEHVGVLTGVVAAIAGADGDIDAQERAALQQVFEAAFGTQLSDFVVSALIDDAFEAMEREGAEAYARGLGEKLAEKSLGAAGVRLAVAIGESNADFKAEERGLVRAMAGGAGLSEGDLSALMD